MPEEPTLGELMRAVERVGAEQRDFRVEMGARLDKTVTIDIHQAEQRRVDGRFKDLADDVVALNDALRTETTERKEAVRGIEARSRAALTTAIGIAALLLTLAGILLQRGG